MTEPRTADTPIVDDVDELPPEEVSTMLLAAADHGPTAYRRARGWTGGEGTQGRIRRQVGDAPRMFTPIVDA